MLKLGELKVLLKNHLMLIIILTLFPSMMYSQMTFVANTLSISETNTLSPLKQKKNKEIQFGLHSGVVLLWGDGSDKFSNPLAKYLDSYERGYFYSLSAAYRHRHCLASEFKIGFGNSQGIRTFHGVNTSPHLRFENNFFDIELVGVFYPLQLILGENFRFADPYVFAGIGLSSYRSVQYKLLENTVSQFYGYQSAGLEKSSPEVVFSLPYGLGVDLRFIKNLSFNFNYTYVYLTSDTFDAFAGNKGKVKDIYSLTTIGIKYHINPMKKVSKQRSDQIIIDEPFVPVPLERSLPEQSEIEPQVIEHNVKVKRERK